MDEQNSGTIVREIIDAGRYMVLATADASGTPWASPVYFAHEGYTDFFWVSSPTVAHSLNIALRPQVGIVIFDSQAAIGTGQGVYMTAVAQPVAAAGLDRGLDVYSRRALAHGGRVWTPQDLQESGEDAIRLYQSTATSHSILAKDGRPDHRIAADLVPR